MSLAARLVERPLEAGALATEVGQRANGAVLLFVGIVREVNDGRGVTGIDYTAYESMARRELTAIVQEAGERFGVLDLVVEHRVGTLAIGEASVAIAVGSPHRADAYAVSRWVIEELKRRVPIWKREHYVDGTREWVDPAGARAPAAGASA
jgi:molybdopterin synthase catalytic subunit